MSGLTERQIVRVIADKTTAAPGICAAFASLAYYEIVDGVSNWFVMREQDGRFDFVPLEEWWEIAYVDSVDMTEIMEIAAFREAIERAGI